MDIEIYSEPLSLDTVRVLIQNELLQKVKDLSLFRLNIKTWQKDWDSNEDRTLKILDLKMFEDNKTFEVVIQYGKDNKKVIGEVVKQQQIPVLANSLPQNREIKVSDIVFREIDEDKIKGDIILTKQELVGMKIKKNYVVKNNVPIKHYEVEKPLAIHKGQQVRIYFVDPSFEISTIGWAKSDGAVGDNIAFEVAHKKNIQATVLNSSRANIYNG